MIQVMTVRFRKWKSNKNSQTLVTINWRWEKRKFWKYCA